MRDYDLGSVGGLQLTAKPAALVGSAALLALFTVIGLIIGFSLGTALFGGLVALALHWISEIVHCLGHAVFARQTGYPMLGITLGTYGIFATTVYPASEPLLPDSVHLHRALGGPFISLQLALLGGLVLFIQSQGERGLAWWLSLFFFLENLFVYTLQAAIPLGFNDGETIWQILRKK
jgi:Zn-dependent protease